MALLNGLEFFLVDFADECFYLTSSMDFGTEEMFKMPDHLLY